MTTPSDKRLSFSSRQNPFYIFILLMKLFFSYFFFSQSKNKFQTLIKNYYMKSYKLMVSTPLLVFFSFYISFKLLELK